MTGVAAAAGKRALHPESPPRMTSLSLLFASLASLRCRRAMGAGRRCRGLRSDWCRLCKERQVNQPRVAKQTGSYSILRGNSQTFAKTHWFEGVRWRRECLSEEIAEI